MLLNVAIVGGATFIGVNVPTVLEPLDLIGGTCSPLIVFILPASAPPRPHLCRPPADVCGVWLSLVIFLGDTQTAGDGDKRKKAELMKWMGFGLIPLCTFITLWGMLTESHSE